MSNWALELQQFDIERIWIRGEANILADAPSRAPWEAALAQFLPIPDMPVRDLVHKMYQDPEEVEELVSKRRRVLTSDEAWTSAAGEYQKAHGDNPLGVGSRGGDVPLGTAPQPEEFPLLDRARAEGYQTPEFGTVTPAFGELAESAKEALSAFGKAEVLFQSDEIWPRFPVCVLKDVLSERVSV